MSRGFYPWREIAKVGLGQVVNDHHGEPEPHQATSEGKAPEPSWKCRRVLIQHRRIESVQTHAPVARALANSPSLPA
jgi:hypothetical protein